MKYYLIAGEPSGDLHGANLIRGLKNSDPVAEFRFWGGDKMAAEGGVDSLARHYKTTSFFGIWEVLKNATTILKQIKECKTDIESYRPDVLILVDYPGFNMKMAKFAHQKGIKTFYYIAPKVWAWKEYRVKKIRSYVDKLFIIFPFEIEYFKRHGIEAIYEGNPLCDALEQEFRTISKGEDFLAENGLDKRPIVALLAGSRQGEIRNNMPFMIGLAARFREYQFVVAGVSWLENDLYQEMLRGSGVGFVKDKTYALLYNSEAAVVTSGTATLETALIGTPEVVCYRTNGLTYWIAQRFLRVSYISLVNLIMGREVVRELIQNDMTTDNAATELRQLLQGGTKRDAMFVDYGRLNEIVGRAGASDRIAKRMVAELEKQRDR